MSAMNAFSMRSPARSEHRRSGLGDVQTSRPARPGQGHDPCGNPCGVAAARRHHTMGIEAMRLWSAAMLVACLATIGVPAAASPSPADALPTASLRAYFEAERAAGAERSEPLARALLWTATHSTEAQRIELLDLAARADPAVAEPYLERARLALGNGDVADACAALTAAWRAARSDARGEAFWLQRMVRAFHAALTGVLLTWAGLLVLRAVRLARHSVGAALRSSGAATLLVVVPIIAAVLASSVLGALIALAAASPFVRRRERRLAAVLCGLLAGTEISLQFCAPHAVLLDPRTRTAHIAHLNVAGHDAALEQALAGASQRSAATEVVLGLQARRRGDARAAEAHFVAA